MTICCWRILCFGCNNHYAWTTSPYCLSYPDTTRKQPCQATYPFCSCHRFVSAGNCTQTPNSRLKIYNHINIYIWSYTYIHIYIYGYIIIYIYIYYICILCIPRFCELWGFREFHLLQDRTCAKQRIGMRVSMVRSCIIWRFPNNGGTPKWMVFVMENRTKMDYDCGYPYFRKPPYGQWQGWSNGLCESSFLKYRRWFANCVSLVHRPWKPVKTFQNWGTQNKLDGLLAEKNDQDMGRWLNETFYSVWHIPDSPWTK